tara:strand:- start:184 stop:750 length:567 start_codon:yes stop_codon:yes gene_type:complete
MNKLNVVIFKLSTLYKILVEIKSQLNFNLIYFDEKNESLRKLLTENPETLIISSDEKQNFNNVIFYNKVFKIKNLLQQINIYLSKSKYDLNSNISIGKYVLNVNSRLIFKKELSLKLTEREVNLLIYLNNSNEEYNTLDLQKNVWKHSNILETHTVETHIYRLRKKILDSFGDEKFIINTKKGYKLAK